MGPHIESMQRLQHTQRVRGYAGMQQVVRRRSWRAGGGGGVGAEHAAVRAPLQVARGLRQPGRAEYVAGRAPAKLVRGMR